MRTLRLSLTGVLALALHGGLGGTVVAQDGTESGPVTHFTGAVVSLTTDDTDEEWWVEDGVGHARTYRLTEMVDWSDPRLPSEKQNVLNFDMYDIGEFRDLPMTGTILLEGPDGYWTGEFTTYCDASGDCFGMNSVTGHGAYDGLFAIFRASPGGDTTVESASVFEGLIFEGEMPPMPDPIELSAE